MAQKFTVPITIKNLSSSGSDAVTIYVDNDTYSRLQIQAGGRLVWSDGANAADTNLYRDSADTLKTDDTFKANKLYVGNVEIDVAGAVVGNALVYDGTKFAPGAGGGSGNASLTVSDTPPVSPDVGDLWFESDTGKTFVYYDSTWVEIGGDTGVGPTGPTGPEGIILQSTAPTNTSILWGDTSLEGDAVVPIGGTTGQVLTKIDSTDYNTEWSSPSVLQFQPLPVQEDGTKGYGMLGVNTNYYRIGNEYADVTSYEPFVVLSTVTITAVALKVISAGDTVLIGVYEADNDWQPTNLVADLGSIDISTTGFKELIDLNIVLTPGVYLWARHHKNSSGFLNGRSGNPLTGFFNMSTDTSDDVTTKLYVEEEIDSFPNIGTKWTTYDLLGSDYYGFDYAVWAQWS